MSRREHRLRVVLIEADPTAPLLDSRKEIVITGRRNIETLLHLNQVGKRGITSIDHWATGKRLSHYVMQLRRAGLKIETHNENAGDGVWYGRYKLVSQIELPDATDDAEAA